MPSQRPHETTTPRTHVTHSDTRPVAPWWSLFKRLDARAVIAASAAAPPATRENAEPLVLAAFALLALVLASGSLVHLLARSQGLWRRA